MTSKAVTVSPTSTLPDSQVSQRSDRPHMVRNLVDSPFMNPSYARPGSAATGRLRSASFVAIIADGNPYFICSSTRRKIMRTLPAFLSIAILLALGAVASATTLVVDYEDLTEGTLGDPFVHQGVTYHDLNTVGGAFPSGETFDPQPDDEFVAEDAGLFYGDFPDFGSPTNALTFGIAYIPGENLTIGPLATVTMDLPGMATEASLDIGYYENGPWGGIVYHLDGLLAGVVVASDSFIITGGADRDNPAWSTLAVSGAGFDQLHLYATWADGYSMPRGMIDDLTLVLDTVTTEASTWSTLKQLFE